METFTQSDVHAILETKRPKARICIASLVFLFLIPVFCCVLAGCSGNRGDTLRIRVSPGDSFSVSLAMDTTMDNGEPLGRSQATMRMDVTVEAKKAVAGGLIEASITHQRIQSSLTNRMMAAVHGTVYPGYDSSEARTDDQTPQERALDDLTQNTITVLLDESSVVRRIGDVGNLNRKNPALESVLSLNGLGELTGAQYIIFEPGKPVNEGDIWEIKADEYGITGTAKHIGYERIGWTRCVIVELSTRAEHDISHSYDDGNRHSVSDTMQGHLFWDTGRDQVRKSDWMQTMVLSTVDAVSGRTNEVVSIGSMKVTMDPH